MLVAFSLQRSYYSLESRYNYIHICISLEFERIISFLISMSGGCTLTTFILICHFTLVYFNIKLHHTGII